VVSTANLNRGVYPYTGMWGLEADLTVSVDEGGVLKKTGPATKKWAIGFFDTDWSVAQCNKSV